MAESAKRVVDESTPSTSELLSAMLPKRFAVASLTTKPGGVELPGQGTQTFIATDRAKNRPVLGVAPTHLEMVYDTALGGVLVRYKYQGKQQTRLIPIGHIQQLELIEE